MRNGILYGTSHVKEAQLLVFLFFLLTLDIVQEKQQGHSSLLLKHYPPHDITELNESLNRSELLGTPCFSSGDAQCVKVTNRCWRQKDSSLS